jgi:solute carrier family 25 carnitine/acylcarnitine transporter 20/29
MADNGHQTGYQFKWKDALKDIIGGTMGGMGLVAVGHPFDTLKVRLQTQPLLNPIYKGVIDCARKTMGGEGIAGFYKGVLSPLSGQMFLNATQFFAWGQSCKFVSGGKPKDLLTTKEYLMAGVFTGIMCAFVENPIDFFKSQLQVQVFKEKPMYTTVPQAVKYILSNYGILGAYQGLSATIIRNLPFRSSYFGTYETVLKYLRSPDEKRDEVTFGKILFAGGCAGAMQWFICYPLDVLKSTMMADHPDKSQRKYKNWGDCVVKLYKEGGLRAFTRGFVPCMLRSFPANAVCLGVYEYTLLVLEDF